MSTEVDNFPFREGNPFYFDEQLSIANIPEPPKRIDPISKNSFDERSILPIKPFTDSLSKGKIDGNKLQLSLSRDNSFGSPRSSKDASLTNYKNTHRRSAILPITNSYDLNIFLPLRGINPYEIWKQYNQGEFSKTPIPSTVKDKYQDNRYINCPLGNNRYDEKYQEVNGGHTHLIWTTNQLDFQKANETIQNDGSPLEITILKTGLCRWCRKELSELEENEYPCGIPIKVTRCGKFYIFHLLYKFCDFKCAYGYCLFTASGDKSVSDCIPYLKLLFNLLYPKMTLMPAPHWERHKRNGGEMDDTSFYSTRFVYYKRHNIITLPTKEEYGVMLS